MAPESPFVVGPYLQFPTRDSITIMWETALPGDSTVEYGTSLPLKEKVSENKNATMHEVTLRDLKPNISYLYRVSTRDGDGRAFAGELLQFKTAVDEDSAFSFGVIGDTQKNPKMTAQIAKLIWDRRPNFVIHLGDVVDNGPDKEGMGQRTFWTVPGTLQPIARVSDHWQPRTESRSLLQVLQPPAPEYHYRYRYGNADFFVLDSNKSLKPDSEQFKWLDAELGKSTAKWKFAYHHHPAWSSDEDDYGDTRKNISRLGDLNARNLSPCTRSTMWTSSSTDTSTPTNGHGPWRRQSEHERRRYLRDIGRRRRQIGRLQPVAHMVQGTAAGRTSTFATSIFRETASSSKPLTRRGIYSISSICESEAVSEIAAGTTTFIHTLHNNYSIGVFDV